MEPPKAWVEKPAGHARPPAHQEGHRQGNVCHLCDGRSFCTFGGVGDTSLTYDCVQQFGDWRVSDLNILTPFATDAQGRVFSEGRLKCMCAGKGRALLQAGAALGLQT